MGVESDGFIGVGSWRSEVNLELGEFREDG